jgi:hypothetical protein
MLLVVPIALLIVCLLIRLIFGKQAGKEAFGVFNVFAIAFAVVAVGALIYVLLTTTPSSFERGGH